jgi:hypothetical protein
LSVKNAKIWPKGTSFTATTCALVYLLDEAGLRTTTDIFHDLWASDISRHSLIGVVVATFSDPDHNSCSHRESTMSEAQRSWKMSVVVRRPARSSR